jgi:hypothetical protein
MSGDRPASRFTRWLSLIAFIAALTGVIVGLGGAVRAEASLSSSQTVPAMARFAA